MEVVSVKSTNLMEYARVTAAATARTLLDLCVIFDRQIAAKQNPLPSRFGTFSGSFWLLVAKAARLWASIKTAPKKKA